MAPPAARAQRRSLLLTGAVLALATACSGGSAPPTATPSTAAPAPANPSTPSPSTPSPSTPSVESPPLPAASPPASTPPSPSSTRPAAFDTGAALADVRHLAGTVGPRPATSSAYRRAARWVERRFADLGYAVQRQAFRAPAGVSWGVRVPAGRTWNVVARRPGLRPGQPYVIVGAHLDTVPQAPGAEDNASGVSVVLELARLAAAGTRLPVVLVAYGAEEPRGDGDDLHHFGSRTQVARLDATERASLRAMVALDRVGVGATVPVCTGGVGPGDVRRSLLAAARRVGVPARSCAGNRASDHWSFEKVGLPAARVGSTPYAAYHSAADVPRVVNPAQLRRTGRLLWEWLRA
jgi:aminopeptidase YwaD